MANTPYAKFRLGQHTLDDLDALAAGKGGVRSAALRDAIHYWRHEVEAAGRLNAEEFDREDWIRLIHLNDPNDLPHEVEDAPGPPVRDWGKRLALELVGMWEGKPLLPMHRAEKKACDKLAARVGTLSLARGYALYLCLSHVWSLEAPGDGEWWTPETWLTPTARPDAVAEARPGEGE